MGTPPETDCGYLKDSLDIAADVTADCDADGKCVFSCPAITDYLETSIVHCVGGKYTSAGAQIACDGTKDTACGNVEIEGFTSTKACADNSCAFTCAAGQHLNGITQASCTNVEGVKEWAYLYNLPAAIDTADYSNCAITMCGEIADIPLDIDQSSVTIDTSATVVTGFGMISFTCADAGDVVSGLNGQSEIGCDMASGNFSIGTASEDALVKCGKTVCGGPEDVLEIDAGVDYVCDDTSGVCTFSCGAGRNAVRPSLGNIVCNKATSKWATGAITRVSCNANCPPFGPDSGFRLDTKLIKKCKQMPDGLEQCDLMCRNMAKPAVDQTKQLLDRIRCHQDEDTGDAMWMAVSHSSFGVPSLETIEQAPNATAVAIRDVVCDKEVIIVPPKPKRCDSIQDHYKINSNVKKRCSKDLCSFHCGKGQKLNRDITHIFCLPNGDSPIWFPPADGEIKCIDMDDVEEDNEEDKNKCAPLENPIDDDVNVSCKNGVCKFKCNDGTASIASATCFNGKWNINDKFAIQCEGKTTTTKKSTTTTAEPPTTTTEEFCGKKCQKQKEKEQKEKIRKMKITTTMMVKKNATRNVKRKRTRRTRKKTRVRTRIRTRTRTRVRTRERTKRRT